jgi:hypothetical protein
VAALVRHIPILFQDENCNQLPQPEQNRVLFEGRVVVGKAVDIRLGIKSVCYKYHDQRKYSDLKYESQSKSDRGVLWLPVGDSGIE